MPSGITSDIYEGKDVTLRDYLMTVGRQMSMSIMQRDSDPSEPVKLREVSDHYEKSLAEKQERLDQLQSMTLREAALEAGKELIEVQRAHEEAKRDEAELRQRYEAMVERVEAWKPEPVVQYVKEHALRFLRESIDFDCGKVYPAKPVAEDYEPERWLASKIERAKHDVEFYGKMYQEEVERVAGFNLHIEAFHRSLPDA